MSDFPEIYRGAVSEAGPARLWAGAITVNVICLCAYLIAKNAEMSEPLYYGVLGLQAMILLIYGAQRAAACVAKERSGRTWDFQRITPLTSFELAAGKLAGAPLYAYFLAASAFPWMLVAAFTGPGLSKMLSAYTLLGAMVFLTLTLSLLASSYTEGKDTGSVNTGGAIIGFFALQMVPVILTASGKTSEVRFYGLAIPWVVFITASGLLFGCWAFAAAAWRIGQDLLERRRVWRLPAFLFFLALYISGLTGDNRILAGDAALVALVVPTFFVYGAAFLQAERLDSWRRWTIEARSGRWERAPAWVTGWAALALISAGLAVTKSPWITGRLLVIIPAFAGRDFAFLQWCRFTKSRRPEMMALAYLTLIYWLPSTMIAAFHSSPTSLYLVLPVSRADLSPWLNILPGTLQCLLAAALMWARAKSNESAP